MMIVSSEEDVLRSVDAEFEEPNKAVADDFGRRCDAKTAHHVVSAIATTGMSPLITVTMLMISSRKGRVDIGRIERNSVSGSRRAFRVSKWSIQPIA
jgi:hypothetical protein